MMIDQVGQARQQPPQKWNRCRRLSTRIVVIQYTISVQRLELVMILSANSHRTAEHASDCSKVCAESVDPGSERQSSSDLSGTEGNCDKRSHTLLNVIRGDESVVYAYVPETKLQSSQCKSPGSPRPKKARMQKRKLKMMLICFFDQEGIVHREFVPPGMTSMQTSTVMF